MWAEKGGLDFEGRARWDAWSANKVRPPGHARLLALSIEGACWAAACCACRPPALRQPAPSLQQSTSPAPAARPRPARGATARRRKPPVKTGPLETHLLLTPLPPPQGMAAEKAKLGFVKAYWEFLPKALYSDTRAEAPAAA